MHNARTLMQDEDLNVTSAPTYFHCWSPGTCVDCWLLHGRHWPIFGPGSYDKMEFVFHNAVLPLGHIGSSSILPYSFSTSYNGEQMEVSFRARRVDTWKGRIKAENRKYLRIVYMAVLYAGSLHGSKLEVCMVVCWLVLSLIPR
jgi:hypothetical protein